MVVKKLNIKKVLKKIQSKSKSSSGIVVAIVDIHEIG